MLTKLKTVILSVAALCALAVPIAVPALAFADPVQNGLNCGGQLKITDGSNCPVDASGNTDSLQGLVTKVINIFSIIVGVIAVIMIIVGGLKYITSGGDSGNVSGAKNTIIYAIVGLIIVALAQFIVRFVLSNANNLGN